MVDPNSKLNQSISAVKEITLEMHTYANEHGFVWLNEEEAITRQLEIPNSSGHRGIITKERTWQVPVKIEDRAIWCYWMLKWYAVWEYRPINKKPSAKVMANVEHIFRINSGLPINHNIQFNW
jgi:hypothetical protein